MKCPECGQETDEPHAAHVWVPIGKMTVLNPKLLGIVTNIAEPTPAASDGAPAPEGAAPCTPANIARC